VRPFLNPGQRHVQAVLLAATGPMSGRQVSVATGMAPVTAIKYLNELASFGLATKSRRGRAWQWSPAGRVCTRCNGTGVDTGGQG
jgi:hypothetical protein